MFEKLFEGDPTALEIVMFIMALVLIILSLVITLNCCAQCCCKGNDLQWYEEEDRRFFDKEYYDEICLLLYRHKQMEIKQMEWDHKLNCEREAYKKLHSQQNLLHGRPRTYSERLLLKQELEQFKIDHNIEIKDKELVEVEMGNKRRTWIGLRDDGKFEPVQLPNATVSGIQTTNTSSKHTPIKKSDGHETSV